MNQCSYRCVCVCVLNFQLVIVLCETLSLSWLTNILNTCLFFKHGFHFSSCTIPDLLNSDFNLQINFQLNKYMFLSNFFFLLLITQILTSLFLPISGDGGKNLHFTHVLVIYFKYVLLFFYFFILNFFSLWIRTFLLGKLI